MILTTQNIHRALCETRMARNVAIGLVTTLALAVAPLPASAQSILEGKSNGMRRCVTVILHGTKLVKKINVHGHHFNCRPIRRVNNEQGNDFQQIRLDHAQFGKDDNYFVNFHVDERNVLVEGTLSVWISKGVSIDTIKRNAKYLNLTTAINSVLLELGKFYGRGFQGPAASKSYDDIAQIARAIPAIEVQNWKTAAMQIALVAIAEHGRSGTRAPSTGKTGTSKSPILKYQQPSAGNLVIEKPGASQKPSIREK